MSVYNFNLVGKSKLAIKDFAVKSTVTRFVTASGSMYQVDNIRKKIRRFRFGASGPAPSFRVEGEWKPFFNLTAVEVGKRVTVFWTEQEAPLASSLPLVQAGISVIPLTITNIVTEVVEEDQGDLN